ncbi:hypothetical protein CRYUN_Cryun39dG0039100 [Craigia yunnanensis]
MNVPIVTYEDINQRCRSAVSLIMKSNPEFADSIENICSYKSWEGIIKKLWPKAKFIGAIATGVMSQYTEALDFYGGGFPLVSNYYVCSEVICGINIELLNKPSDVSYSFLPNMAYFEFLPVKKDSVTMSQDQVQFNGISYQEPKEMKSNNEAIEPVDLRKCGAWSIPIQSWRYSYGNWFPQQCTSISVCGAIKCNSKYDAEKTSEADLLRAVTKARALLDPLGFILIGYTSYS